MMPEYYDMLMDPSGGNPIYHNAMVDWGVIGMDLGLGLFGQRIGRSLGRRALASYRAAGESNLLRKRAIINKAVESLPLESNKINFYRPDRSYAREAVRKRALATATEMNQKISGHRNQMYKGARSFGRSMARLGLVTAFAGLVDFGATIYKSMSTPGVSREVIARDQEQVFGNEMLDISAAYTMRQRSIRAIHDSQMSVGRALIGQESSYLHK